MEEGLHNDGDGCYRPRIEGVLTQFLSIGNQIIDHMRIRQGGRVTEVTERFRGDISQNTAHDLTGTCLGQTIRPLNLVG